MRNGINYSLTSRFTCYYRTPWNLLIFCPTTSPVWLIWTTWNLNPLMPGPCLTRTTERPHPPQPSPALPQRRWWKPPSLPDNNLMQLNQSRFTFTSSLVKFCIYAFYYFILSFVLIILSHFVRNSLLHACWFPWPLFAITVTVVVLWSYYCKELYQHQLILATFFFITQLFKPACEHGWVQANKCTGKRAFRKSRNLCYWMLSCVFVDVLEFIKLLK